MRSPLSRTALIFASLLGAPAGAEAPKPAGPARRPSDIVCGPRCLEYIAKSFRPGFSMGLSEIVAQVQPEFEKGASLAHLDRFLNQQGLHTLAIKPAAGTAICWPYPVLLHLSAEDDDLGHYVVLLPGSDRATATVWSGLAGVIKVPTWRLSERIGGGALLISPKPIPPTDPAFPATLDSRVRRVGWATILLATPIIGLALAPSLRRKPSGPVPTSPTS